MVADSLKPGLPPVMTGEQLRERRFSAAYISCDGDKHIILDWELIFGENRS
jgi:hypothetical protein